MSMRTASECVRANSRLLPLLAAGLMLAALFLSHGAARADESCSFTPTKPTVAPGPTIIKLPADQANHPKVDTEWWYYVGTLKAPDRTFGVEINISRFGNAVATSWVTISDVTGDAHYQAVLNYPMATLKTSADTFIAELPTISMSGPLDAMHVTATLAEGSIDLTVANEGPPLSVWGTGWHDTGKFITNYYSLTNLQAKGTLTLNGTAYDVSGLLWMDHEYGGWGRNLKWAWQNMQLDNGVRIMAFTVGGFPSVDGQPREGTANVQMPDGTLYLEPITMTPRKPSWTSDVTKNEYFLKWTTAIPGLNACLSLTSAPANQEFIIPAMGKMVPQSGIYEGVSTVEGTFDGKPVAGQGWSEQVP